MLTLKKRLFIDYYKACKNASEAARQAGYSARSAGTTGHSILKDPEIHRILAEWEQEEAKKLVPQTKDEYAAQTFERSRSVKHEPTKAKYWEIGGKVKGYIGEDGSAGRDIHVTMNIIANELRMALNPASTNPPPLPNHITPNALPSQEIAPLKSVHKDLSEGGRGGVGTAPEGGQDISINPLPKSPQFLNSGEESQKLDINEDKPDEAGPTS